MLTLHERHHQARRLAAAAPHSGDWLHVLLIIFIIIIIAHIEKNIELTYFILRVALG